MSDVMDTDKENIENGAANVKGKKSAIMRIEAKFYAGLLSTIVHDGFPFTPKKVNVNATHELYWCRHIHGHCAS